MVSSRHADHHDYPVPGDHPAVAACFRRRDRSQDRARRFAAVVSAPFYYRATEGIRVTVRPAYSLADSRPERGRHVFTYFVRIENVSVHTVQLLRRRWLIHDSTAEALVVEGDGVVGQQPVLAPGAVHEYESFCILTSGLGHMEGAYIFARQDGETFEAEIPRFELRASEPGPRRA